VLRRNNYIFSVVVVHFEDYVECSGILPTIKRPLMIRNCDYEKPGIDNVIIGIKLAQNAYDEWNLLEEIDYNDNVDIVKNELKNQFGVDVEPKLYFYFNVS
jgi:hypothetical protein